MKIFSKNSNLRWIVSIIVLLIFYCWYFYYYIDSIIILIDNSIMYYYPHYHNYTIITREYGSFICIIGSLSFCFCLIYRILVKRDNTFLKWNKLLIILLSFLLVGMLAFIIKDGSYWYLKYIIGLLVGAMVYLFSAKTDRYLELFAGIVSVSAILFYDRVEYYFVLELPKHPSISYIGTFSTFYLWFVTLLSIYLSGYFLVVILKKVM